VEAHKVAIAFMYSAARREGSVPGGLVVDGAGTLTAVHDGVLSG